jgi:hypothetical protein
MLSPHSFPRLHFLVKICTGQSLQIKKKEEIWISTERTAGLYADRVPDGLQDRKFATVLPALARTKFETEAEQGRSWGLRAKSTPT